MNNSLTRITLAVLVLSIALFAICCRTRSISLQMLVPASITIPGDINKVAILNRSLPSKNNQLVNILEGFISGESILADREGSFNCIRGVEARLIESPRLKAVAIESDHYRGTGTRQFPELLDWNSVDALCKQYNVDAILSLETFDSNFDLKKRTTEQKEKKEGKEVVTKVYHADLTVNVNSGWRLYDNINRTIIDQVSFTDEKGWSEEGATSQAAVNKLPHKRNAINESGRLAGFQIANRISPNWRTERRPYYVKGNDDFKTAKQQVKFNNWDAAAIIWKKLAENPDPVIAGRACYNLAIASEIKGNIDMAIYWAEKSMKVYHDKKARGYVDILYRRSSDAKRLEEQMK